MRASMSSPSGWENVANVRTLGSVVSNADTLVIWKPPAGASPKNMRRKATCAVSWQLCPDGHSGYGAVMSAVHAASAVVAGLPSSAARGMAFHGRQKSKWYLSFQQLIDASAALEVLHRQQPGGVGGVEVVPGDELAGHLVPAPSGCALPPPGDVGLIGRASRAGGPAQAR